MSWNRLKQDFKERFMDFESFNGAFIMVPWGVGLIYFTLYDQPFSYTYAFVSGGMVAVIWGLRKAFVNRIKQQIKVNDLISQRKCHGDL